MAKGTGEPVATLLHLDSSADRSNQSISRQLTALFAGTWQALHGSAGYRYRDLAADPVPPLSTAYCGLGRRVERHGLVPPDMVAALAQNPAEQWEWELTRPLITELLAAGTVVIGAPMYNYSVPAALKAWIDRVSFPGAFADPHTGQSLLRDTKVVVIIARGGAYGPGSPREGWDFQTPYLRTYFGKHGVAEQNMCFISAEMTKAGLVPHLARFRPLAASSLAAARAEVTALATTVTCSTSLETA
jgi:FMN-dependent NADH-azoreductase